MNLTPDQIYALRNRAVMQLAAIRRLYAEGQAGTRDLLAAQREYDDAQARVRLLEAPPASLPLEPQP